MEGKARNFRNYEVWQVAKAYAVKVYKVTNDMPWFEKKGLCDQLQRAVVSISSNIAEGAAKPSDADFAKFLDTALGRAFEVETQLMIARDLGYFNNVDLSVDKEQYYNELMDDVQSIERQLNGLIRSIRNNSQR